MNEDKLELINDFSNYFEEVYKFPPLTSKIYSYLILDISKEGTTFDELVEVFNASKSSVSNSLNFLSQLDYVEHFTKIDTRKRFYRVASGSIMVRLKRFSSILQQEKNLINKFINYVNQQTASEQKKSLLDNSEIYIKYLDHSIEKLDETIKEFETLTE